MPRSRFTTYVIALPADAEARPRLLAALASTVADHGGQITAISLSDEISICERLEEELPHWQVADIRREIEALPVPNIAAQPTVDR